MYAANKMYVADRKIYVADRKMYVAETGRCMLQRQEDVLMLQRQARAGYRHAVSWVRFHVQDLSACRQRL